MGPAARRLVKTLSLTDIRLDPSSYADPNGFLFHYQGGIYRAIARPQEAFYRALLDRPIMAALFEKRALAPAKIADLSIPEAGSSLVLAHEPIRPVSYCVEWSPSLLRAAAKATLELASSLAGEGLLLQDAHPWNIVFDGARPCFVDLTSIVAAEGSKLPWPAYQQFLNFFLYPLELCAMGKGPEARALLDPARRSDFQVLVMPNMWGDILTDEAAQIQGGVGTAGSANIGKRHAMFEAIHGSAPRMVAEGRAQYADPSSMVRAGAMMLETLGESSSAQAIERAVMAVTAKKLKSLAAGQMGYSTAEVGDLVVEALPGAGRR